MTDWNHIPDNLQWSVKQQAWVVRAQFSLLCTYESRWSLCWLLVGSYRSTTEITFWPSSQGLISKGLLGILQCCAEETRGEQGEHICLGFSHLTDNGLYHISQRQRKKCIRYTMKTLIVGLFRHKSHKSTGFWEVVSHKTKLKHCFFSKGREIIINILYVVKGTNMYRAVCICNVAPWFGLQSPSIVSNWCHIYYEIKTTVLNIQNCLENAAWQLNSMWK